MNKWLFILTLVLMGLAGSSFAGTYGGGSGTAEDPYQIRTAGQLNEIGLHEEDWDKHFILIEDISLSGFSGQTLNQIGRYSSKPFTGVFDGNDHEISNLNVTGSYFMGLFMYVENRLAQIKNLTLRNFIINPDAADANGSLVGILEEGTIANCSIQAQVSGYNTVGGLVGENHGSILDCDAIVSITFPSPRNPICGGLVGFNEGSIERCNVEGEVTGHRDSNSNVGGLVGQNLLGTISHCSFDGTVTGHMYVGGLVGLHSQGRISYGHTSGNVLGSNGVGGLVGLNTQGIISNCSSECNVECDNYSFGGLVGESTGNESVICHSFATGNVSGFTSVGSGVSNAGGLVGNNDSQIVNCYSSSNVNVERWSHNTGGLIGRNRGQLINCYSSGRVSRGENAWNTGGLIGQNESGGTIIQSFWDVQASGQGQMCGQGVGDNSAGKTTNEMRTVSTFIGWPCGVWTLHEGHDYPRLWWQNSPGETIPDEFYVGGSGRMDDPYLINNVEQLNRLGLWICDKSMSFKMVQDIDLDSFEGEEFNLIGTSILDPFTGIFDGDGHVISNFHYHTTNYFPSKGLFGYVRGTMAEIKNITLQDCEFVAVQVVGLLMGTLYDGTVVNCHIEDASVAGSSAIGGIIGLIWTGTVSECTYHGTVKGNPAGGIAGANRTGYLSQCNAVVDFGNGVAIQRSDLFPPFGIGGLVGVNEGMIFNCQSTTTYQGYDSGTGIGGLVGGNHGIIMSCQANGNFVGESSIGGLTGVNTEAGTILCCSADATIQSNRSGGLVAENHGTIARCFAMGVIEDGSLNQGNGGLVWSNVGIISDSYARSNVSAVSNVGGLVGENKGTILRTYSTGSVMGDFLTGGLVGWTHGEGIVQTSFWDRETSGLDSSSGGVDKSTSEMQIKQTFLDAGWDFTNESINGTADIWRLCEDGTDYPHLAWEFGSDYFCPDGVSIEDLLYLSSRWLESNLDPYTSADRTGDGIVNLEDWVLLSEQWRN